MAVRVSFFGGSAEPESTMWFHNWFEVDMMLSGNAASVVVLRLFCSVSNLSEECYQQSRQCMDGCAVSW